MERRASAEPARAATKVIECILNYSIADKSGIGGRIQELNKGLIDETKEQRKEDIKCTEVTSIP